MIEETEIAR